MTCVHRWKLEGCGMAAPATCAHCGATRTFSGGYTPDNTVIRPRGEAPILLRRKVML